MTPSFQRGAAAAALALALAACAPAQRNFTGGTGGASSTSSSGTMSGTGGAGGADDPAAVCAAYGTVVCDNYQKCAPDVVTGQFGDQASCAARYALFCSLVLSAPQTSWTAAGMKACAAELGPLACPDFLLAPFTGGPAACLPAPGALDNGSACVDAGQCQSAYCKRAGLSLCGSCAPRSDVGQPCGITGDCKLGLSCVGGTCAKAAKLADPCAPGQIECDLGLVCVSGACQPYVEEGQSCDANQASCNFLEGLYCPSGPFKCARAMYGNPGDACGLMNNSLVACAGAGICDPAKAACVAPAADGMPCDAKVGPGCMLPAVCINGVCSLAKPAACP